MEGLDISDYAATVIQLPIVGLFIWVVFRFMKEHREEREKISDRFADSVDKSSDAITQLNATTQQFHTEVKEWRRENQRAHE